MLKVLTVAGARSEIAGPSGVIKLLGRTVQHVLVHAGQQYDYTPNEVFFEDLGLRQPDHMPGVDTVRDSIERPEALDTGGVILPGLNTERVIEAIRVAQQDSPEQCLARLDGPQRTGLKSQALQSCREWWTDASSSENMVNKVVREMRGGDD